MRAGPAWLWLTGVIALVIVTALRLAPPAPRGEDAPNDTFSAGRAAATLGRWLEPERPHPTGSPENVEQRRRLVAELQRLGLEPILDSGVACDEPRGVCAFVTNVIAVVPGASADVRVALAAHYDSAPAAPGAADDGHGVAVLLEVARALRAAPLEAPVALIFSDGEELGLLGARRMVQGHALVRALEVVINVEARGTRGPSLMFQTSRGAAWLVERYARSAPRPVTSSLMAAVYRVLPNDTDLTIFARAGLQGLNFAFIGGVESYHTPNDRLAALELGSLQQQGDAVLALARDLARHGVEPPASEAAYFDVLGAFVVRAPLALSGVLAALATALLVGSLGLELARARGERRQWLRALARGGAGLALTVALPGVGAALLVRGLAAAGVAPFFFIAEPRPLLAAFVLLALLGQALAVRARRSTLEELAAWDALWLGWLALGGLLLSTLPEASFLVWPALVAGLGRAIGRQRASYAPVVAMVWLVWAPPLLLAHDALGLALPAALGVALGIALGPLAFLLQPLLAHQRAPLALAGGALAAALLQCAFEPSSPAVPRRLSLALEVDPEGRARWLADAEGLPLPRALGELARWSPRARGAHAWSSYAPPPLAEAEARVAAPAAPRVEVVGSHETRLELEVTLAPRAWAVSVHVPDPVHIARASWQGVSTRARPQGSWSTVTLVPEPDERVLRVAIETSRPLRAPFEVTQITRGLPHEAGPLLAARGAAVVPSHLGDLTLLRVRAAPP